MKHKVGILTVFNDADAAYSLVNVVRTQAEMLARSERFEPVLFVTDKFPEGRPGVWSGKKVELRRTCDPDWKAEEIVKALRPLIGDIEVMLCHDVVFLSQYREWGEAVRILAREMGIGWVHWQHSRGDHVAEACENAWYAYPNQGDLEHVAKMNQAPLERVRYIPHPIDLEYLGWPELAIRIGEDTRLPYVDVGAVLPTRLDRHKQVEKALRIMAGIKKAGRSVRFVVADAFATGQRFLDYKRDLHEIAKEQDMQAELVFLGERYEECRFATPRPVVKALYEMSNLFIQPSNSETSSLVAMEAALAGNLLVINADFKPIHHLYKKALVQPFGSVLEPDVKYFKHIKTADGGEVKVEDPQQWWDDQARASILPALDGQIIQSVKRQQFRDRMPEIVRKDYLEPLLEEVIVVMSPKDSTPHPSPLPEAGRGGKEEGGEVMLDYRRVYGDPEVTAIITTLDNLPMLKRQMAMMLDEAGQVIVVSNGSTDGTVEYIRELNDPRVRLIERENRGAGPGRNAGLALWGESTPYTLMVDGGILPARGITKAMKDYLTRHPEVEVVSPEIASCYTTDEAEADFFFSEIDDSQTFPQRMLSGTACALCKASAWRVKFSEEGPFAEPGWGVDDNDMNMRWNEAGVVHHDFGGVKLLRRASGSFQRLFQETGIWPNQYGSVYEKRNVKANQDWINKGFDLIYGLSRIDVSVVILAWNEYPLVAKVIKACHDQLQPVPHEVIVVDNGSSDGLRWWLDTFALRWHWGDCVTTPEGTILRKVNPSDQGQAGTVRESIWNREAQQEELVGERPELYPLWSGDVRRIDLKENMGTGCGFNIGMEVARGKYIFYIAGDMLPAEGTIPALMEQLEQHEDMDYVGVNAWVCQAETEAVKFDGFGTRQGLGNYAYSYAMIRREVWDAGVRFAEEGPFAGPGCGFEEVEFAYRMYERGFKGWLFNDPGYFHERRDGRRSGLPAVIQEAVPTLDERRGWLATRWNECNFAITHYHEQPPERHVRRLAIINKAAPGHPGPANFLWNAAQQICVAELFEPSAVPEGYDYYLFVDDGDWDAYHCPEHAHPSCFWAIDMIYPHQGWRMSPDAFVERMRTFDRAFVAQKSGFDYCREKGLEATWLPLAADPAHHRYLPDTPKEYNWIALWHNTGERPELAEKLGLAIPGYVTYADDVEYARWMAKGRCALNKSRSNEVNMRVFEVAAMGVPLVTDRVPDLGEFFQEDTHYLGYDSAEEAIEKVGWVINHPLGAQKMALRAREIALGRHTYYHRLLSMFYP